MEILRLTGHPGTETMTLNKENGVNSATHVPHQLCLLPLCPLRTLLSHLQNTTKKKKKFNVIAMTVYTERIRFLKVFSHSLLNLILILAVYLLRNFIGD